MDIGGNHIDDDNSRISYRRELSVVSRPFEGPGRKCVSFNSNRSEVCFNIEINNDGSKLGHDCEVKIVLRETCEQRSAECVKLINGNKTDPSVVVNSNPLRRSTTVLQEPPGDKSNDPSSIGRRRRSNKDVIEDESLKNEITLFEDNNAKAEQSSNVVIKKEYDEHDYDQDAINADDAIMSIERSTTMVDFVNTEHRDSASHVVDCKNSIEKEFTRSPLLLDSNECGTVGNDVAAANGKNTSSEDYKEQATATVSGENAELHVSDQLND